jgi:hypothetical protein
LDLESLEYAYRINISHSRHEAKKEMKSIINYISNQFNVAILYSDEELIEIQKFHLMLLKMKKKRTNFDVKKVMNLVYPNNNIDLNNSK